MGKFMGADDLPLPGAGWWCADRDMWRDGFDPDRPVETEVFSRLFQSAILQELEWLCHEADTNPAFASWSALLRAAALLYAFGGEV